jgi:hypothetical protein
MKEDHVTVNRRQRGDGVAVLVKNVARARTCAVRVFVGLPYFMIDR